MRICQAHWTMIRESVKAHGMEELGATTGEEAAANFEAELSGEAVKFDPNMSHNMHWTNAALKHGGIYLMECDSAVRPENDGHYCPVCEIAAHYAGWEPQTEIDSVSKQMQAWCREQGLIPKEQ